MHVCRARLIGINFLEVLLEEFADKSCQVAHFSNTWHPGTMGCIAALKQHFFDVFGRPA